MAGKSTPSVEIAVQLTSGDTTELTLPAQVTIPAGRSSATFDLTIVDDAVIDVENILRRRRNAPHDTDVTALFTRASLEVRRPVFYATAAVAVAFAPILMMTGIQGAFFRPLSIAFLFGLAFLNVRDEAITSSRERLDESRVFSGIM